MMTRTMMQRCVMLVILTMMTVVTLNAAAPAGDTVKVGKETKKTIGTLKKAVAGDVACYLTFKDDRGVVFEEMADFALCEQPKLVGKRLKLTYAIENVLADECQGDPDCKKSKSVVIVKSVKVLGDAIAKPAAPK